MPAHIKDRPRIVIIGKEIWGLRIVKKAVDEEIFSVGKEIFPGAKDFWTVRIVILPSCNEV